MVRIMAVDNSGLHIFTLSESRSPYIFSKVGISSGALFRDRLSIVRKNICFDPSEGLRVCLETGRQENIRWHDDNDDRDSTVNVLYSRPSLYVPLHCSGQNR